MVISYNQNLKFKIHYKKLREQDYTFISSYFHTIKKITQNMNIKFIIVFFASMY